MQDTFMQIKFSISQLVLNWYHVHGRKNLPWQQIKRNPYNVWISEIMLQQTQVNTVIPYYLQFIKKFPNINILCKSSLNSILYLWSGLGYYNRAHNIYKTANIIKTKFNGKFPSTFTNIINLPGIGPSTAGAILSFGFNFCFPILDGNVKRILSRYYNITAHNKTLFEKTLWKTIHLITPIYNTDKFNQALMDLGSFICTRSKPKCILCPLNNKCAFVSNAIKLNTIKKSSSNIKNINFWFLILQHKHSIFLEQRHKTTIWKGLFCFLQFNDKSSIINWINNNNTLIKKQKMLQPTKCKISNITLDIIPIWIKIKKKINICNNRNNIWYNLKHPQHIGLPTPIKNIIILHIK